MSQPTDQTTQARDLAAQLAALSAAQKLPTGMDLYRAQVESGAAARETVTDNAIAQVGALLRSFKGWYNDSEAAKLVRKMLAIVQGGQRAAVSQENAYMGYILRSQTGVMTPSAPLVRVDDLRNGVDMQTVYARLPREFRYQRSLGKEYAEALKLTLDRADSMVDTDITLAVRAQDREVLTRASKVIGYRRVIHPELSKGGTCGLCIASSTRRYHKEDLLPIHGRCHCTVAPILDDGSDPGDDLNGISLSDLYTDAGSTSSEDLKRTRYQIDEHGELGPVLIPERRPKKTSGTRAGKGSSRAATNSRQEKTA